MSRSHVEACICISVLIPKMTKTDGTVLVQMHLANEVILLLCPTGSVHPSSISRKQLTHIKCDESADTDSNLSFYCTVRNPLWSLKMQRHSCWVIWWLSAQILSWSTGSSISEPCSVYIISPTHQSWTDSKTSSRPSHCINHTHSVYHLRGMKKSLKHLFCFWIPEFCLTRSLHHFMVQV